MKPAKWLLCLLLIACASRQKRFEPPETVGVTGLLRVHNQFVDVYAFPVGGGAILIDAGVDPEGNGIDAMLHRFQLSKANVGAIFFTHGHGDHTSAATIFPNAQLYGGKADAPLFDGTYENPKRLSRLFSKSFKGQHFTLKNGLEGRVEIPVNEGQEKVIALPFTGHTPGSYYYLFRGVLFTGDTIQYKKGKLTPAPKMFHSDVKQNLESIINLPTLLTGLTVEQICTGHWGCTPFGESQALIEGLVASAKEKLAKEK